MKKFIGLFLLFCLFIVNYASAEAEHIEMEGAFSIRGGITFRMTPEEVKALEDNSYFCEERIINIGGKDWYTIEYDGYKSLAGITLYLGVMGNRTGSITYFFDNETKLLSKLCYDFGAPKSMSEPFVELKDLLIEKYGEPTHFNDGIINPGSELADRIATDTLGAKIANYCEWILKYDNYYVTIDAYVEAFNEPAWCTLSYKYISIERMEEIMTNLENEQKKKEEQISHDI